MALLDDLAATDARADLTREQKYRERSRLKAAHLVALETKLPFTVARGTVEATIKSLSVNAAGGLVVDLDVTIGGKPLDRKFLPFVYHNVPVLVPDPAGAIVRSFEDPVTGELQEQRFRFDPAAALRAALADTLRQVAR